MFRNVAGCTTPLGTWWGLRDDRHQGRRRPPRARRAGADTPSGAAGTQRRPLVSPRTDHKVIGNLYFITSFVFFLLGGVLALLIRAELFAPGLQIVDNPEQYNQLFTMHGTIMLLLFATPLFAGFANAMMPLQIGAPDVAFPRLNMFAYWLYLFGGLIAAAGFLTPQGAAAFGWTAYAPLSDVSYSPGLGGDLWVFGLALAGFGTILGAVNFITTIICLRAPGMTMFRMPIFTWTVLDHLDPGPDRVPGTRRRAARPRGRPAASARTSSTPRTAGRCSGSTCSGSSAIPRSTSSRCRSSGSSARSSPSFSRKPVFGYKTMVFATISIAALSVSVWAHHMYATGQVLLPFFAIMSMLIAVPTGVSSSTGSARCGAVSSPSRRRCCGRSASWSRSSSAA